MENSQGEQDCRSPGVGSAFATSSQKQDKKAVEDLDSATLVETKPEETGGSKAYDMACAEVDHVWDEIVKVFKKSGRFDEAEECLTMCGYILDGSRWKRYPKIIDLMRYSDVINEALDLEDEAIELRAKQLIQHGRLSVFGAIQQFEMEKLGTNNPVPTWQTKVREQLWMDYLASKEAEGTFLRAILSRLVGDDMEQAARVIARVVKETKEKMHNKREQFPPNVDVCCRRVREDSTPYIIAIYPQLVEVADAWIACAILFDMHAIWVYGEFGEDVRSRIWPDENGESILDLLNTKKLPIASSHEVKYERRPKLEELEFINRDGVDSVKDFVRDFFPEDFCEQELDPLLTKLEDALTKENTTFLEWMKPARQRFNILTTLRKKYAEDVAKLKACWRST